MATENDLRPRNPTFRTLDWNAEVKRVFGPAWHEPEVSYVFSSGRKFKLQTEDASIYSTSPDF